MATEKQVRYYQSLCEQLGQEPDDAFENLTTKEASEAITELGARKQKKLCLMISAKPYFSHVKKQKKHWRDRNEP
jgi:hypothetical protein